MKIYSTRHGQTDWNRQDIILGTTDIPLNETGIRQAAELAEKVHSIGNTDIIISSPMKRALATANAVAEKCGLEVVIDERLREWDYGRFEGLTRYTEGFHENKVNFGVKMGENGESLMQLCHRVYSALDDIIKKYSNKTVLIVSHGGVCRAIETYFHSMTADEFLNWFMDNCQIIEYNT
ncbi:MAG: histidine phosphatase family protein [Ruminococcus sp.]|nr:histidine phosphatase family protein [Ruminococcus sp.]